MIQQKKTLLIIFMISISLLGLFYGCSSTSSNQQLDFGIEAAKKDLWEEAIFRWKKAIQSNPDSAAAHNNLAVAYEKKGLWEEAKKEYEIALSLNPKDSYINNNYLNFKEIYQSRMKENYEKN